MLQYLFGIVQQTHVCVFFACEDDLKRCVVKTAGRPDPKSVSLPCATQKTRAHLEVMHYPGNNNTSLSLSLYIYIYIYIYRCIYV